MFNWQNLRILIIIFEALQVLIHAESFIPPNWTFDLISLSINNTTPDIALIEVYITRPSRGLTALSGIIDIKEDLNDDVFFNGSTYYSMMGSEFTRQPFKIHKVTLSNAFNLYYKDIVMDSLQSCTENAPWFEDTFVPPLTKRVIRVDNCIISNENMPSRMRSGYYKLFFEYSGRAELQGELMVKVEQR